MKVIKSYQGVTRSQINRVPTESGESLEEMIRRQQTTKQAIDDSAPMIYTPKKDGVIPQYDPRTDRQEEAIEALDKFHKTTMAKVNDEPMIDKDGNIVEEPTELEV